MTTLPSPASHADEGESGRPALPAWAGTFDTHEFSDAAGVRPYKLYVPPSASAKPRPMVVMLHGCTQSPDDFAVGTGMNRLADAHDLLVLYPEQTESANPSKCWSWFNPQHQQREAGEPALIADMTRHVAHRHGADPRRIFIAGFSAGAAMAVVLGETTPDLFAGVGVHSGLPYGCAHDVPTALAVMKGGRNGIAALKDLPGSDAALKRSAVQPVATIVFHGDRDQTVRRSNAEEIVRQVLAAHGADADRGRLHRRADGGKTQGGRRWSRTSFSTDVGQVRIEFWTLHGAGHAWSGGDLRGSYTDTRGADASAEMIRFFLALSP